MTELQLSYSNRQTGKPEVLAVVVRSGLLLACSLAGVYNFSWSIRQLTKMVPVNDKSTVSFAREPVFTKNYRQVFYTLLSACRYLYRISNGGGPEF